MEANPYTITFGKAPKLGIPREVQASAILDAFRSPEPSQQVFMVCGPRGSGKTVFMNDVARRLAHESIWTVVELNPGRDLLESLAAKLSSQTRLARMFRNAQIDLSFFGLGVRIDGVAPIADIEVALDRMIASMAKRGERLLIAIDEVTSTPFMREFAGTFQILLRHDLPVFLLMTGLYENINELQNEKSLTFLYRAPKVELKPLNLGAIARNYRRTLGVDAEESLRMARLTRGYSFAFQVLGYLTWGHDRVDDDIQGMYRQYLDDYVYDKIWAEMSRVDRRVARAAAQVHDGRISAIREILGMESNQFAPYRRRLIRKGVLNGDERGFVRFALPCFEDFVLEQYEEG